MTVVLAAAGAGAATLATATLDRAQPQPTGISGRWNLVFDGEFAGRSLNPSQWSTGWTTAGQELPQEGITAPVNSGEAECYDPRQVTVSGGQLNLTAVGRRETCGGVNRSYASGMVNTSTKFDFAYGVAEARIWLPGPTDGEIVDWPAFWLVGLDWPENGEIDVVEGLGGRACYHYHGPFQGGAGFGGCAAGSYSGGWHTFATSWGPGKVSFYYDGIRQWTDTSHIRSAPMYVILNLAVDPVVGGPTRVPATMRVSYVRVWQQPGCARYGCTVRRSG